MPNKKCIKCLIDKDFSEFYFRSDKKTFKHASCKKCCVKYNNELAAKKMKTDPEFVQKQRERSRAHLLKTKYKITPAHWEMLASNQDYKCKICKKETKLAVDHNHKNEQVRGLLCLACNAGLGQFRDNIETMETAIQYLKDTQNKKSTFVVYERQKNVRP